MRRQKEELDAKNVQVRQQQHGGGRSGLMQAASLPVLEKVADVGDLAAVWRAVRKYVASSVKYIDNVLGHCCRIESLDADLLEAVLFVPGNQRSFANGKPQLKIEEGVRAVTGLPLKLKLHFGEEVVKAPEAEASVGGIAAQRVPPEVIRAVESQAVIKELIKKLDARVVHVELMGAGETE
ncbi:MAG: hypothetical protein FWD53_13525 [Phycisphaerales bacterium]|nr:hypothetical protein [Phycisphaerales bacterium]